MNEGKVEFRRTVLNVPMTVTPLKFKIWLRNEAEQIQNACSESCFAIIKLFLPMRVRLAFQRKELDEFLQDIPNTFPNIHWVDVVQVENSLSEEEMAVIRELEQEKVEELSKSVSEFLRAQPAKK
ncbi:hypothetical protein Q8A64_08125 [Oxalobacteraceae bacterium R-40]|uniref:Uncharacterized protein n=1 Tax=Keguizhuia sedimenti TaxID=3064264 RepID=A0ABU1BN36_9BURK|nr:hypothetical protein [Oxalobacteraceae bacterium R-40]